MNSTAEALWVKLSPSRGTLKFFRQWLLAAVWCLEQGEAGKPWVPCLLQDSGDFGTPCWTCEQGAAALASLRRGQIPVLLGGSIPA